MDAIKLITNDSKIILDIFVKKKNDLFQAIHHCPIHQLFHCQLFYCHFSPNFVKNFSGLLDIFT